jgi:Tfp pilus assembly protein PilO
MSYALRNTLILLVVLTLIVGSGWSYLYFFQQTKIEELEIQLSTKSKELRQKQEIAGQYETILNQFEEARDYFNNYEKALYADNNEDKVFEFLNSINRGSSYTDFTFAFQNSTPADKYGTMSMEITGEGYYRYFVNFIRQIEYSKPLNKISNISITPINDLENYGRVSFKFTLTSFYERTQLLEEPSMDIANAIYASLYNPFYPLIRDVQPNENNLTNVEQSRLLALSADRIFLVDQTGVMRKLQPGDKVYLGTLSNINLREGTATFVLNKGGIIEHVTLEVQN